MRRKGVAPPPEGRRGGGGGEGHEDMTFDPRMLIIRVGRMSCGVIGALQFGIDALWC